MTMIVEPVNKHDTQTEEEKMQSFMYKEKINQVL